jgi:AraC-like DNA-binding protein
MQTVISNFTTGALILLFFLFVTNTRKVNILGNRWLSLFLFCMILPFSNDSLYNLAIFKTYPYLLNIDDFLIFVLAPAIYLSVSHFTSLEKKFKKKDLFHFIPIFIIIIPQIYFFSNYSLNEAYVQMDKFFYVQSQNSNLTILYLVWLQLIIYVFFSFKKIQKHQRQIKMFTSNTDSIDLQWLKMFLIGITIMILIWIVDFYIFESSYSLYDTIGHFLSIFILGYYALNQDEVFKYNEKDLEEIQEIISEEPTKPEKKQLLAEDELASIKLLLKIKMQTEKLYLDETLSLPKLAELLNINSHKLSHALNEGFGENFFQFVNKYRVEEAKTLLLNGETKQLNMLGIAFNSGFNSKTAFNTAFKKSLGMSPTAFLTDKMLGKA